MGDVALNLHDRFTYGDYKTWRRGPTWELIDGTAFAMSPGPNRRHSGLSMRLTLLFGRFLEGKPCVLYAAPFDVLLPAGNEDDDSVETVVQPDLVVYCDNGRDSGLRSGAPGSCGGNPFASTANAT
jgi:Uma2 family endonuclease